MRLVNFGHLGDGNLHYNVQAPEGSDAEAFLQEQEQPMNQLVYDQVEQLPRLHLCRTRHRQPQARQAGPAQISRGAGPDAGHQAGSGFRTI